MVFGRYNELDNYGIHGVYKPTNITGGAHPVVFSPLIMTSPSSHWLRSPSVNRKTFPLETSNAAAQAAAAQVQFGSHIAALESLTASPFQHLDSYAQPGPIINCPALSRGCINSLFQAFASKEMPCLPSKFQRSLPVF